jgi:hypothetical protein
MSQSNKDHGRSGADAPSGHSRAEPEEVSVVPTSVPNAGEWAVVRASYGHPCVQQIAKVTPKLIKFAGLNWPRQCNRSDLLVSLPDKEAAEFVSQSLAGAAGQRESRVRKAREDFDERKAAAWETIRWRPHHCVSDRSAKRCDRNTMTGQTPNRIRS